MNPFPYEAFQNKVCVKIYKIDDLGGSEFLSDHKGPVSVS